MGYGVSSGMLVRLANLRTTEMSTEEFDRLAQSVGDGWRAQGVGFLKAVQYNFMVKVQNPMYFGADTAGVDVTFYGTTTGAKMLWDKSADGLVLTKAGVTVGADGAGRDILFYGTTAGASLLYDVSADELIVTGGALKVATAGEYLKMTNTTGTVNFQLNTTSTGLVVR